MSRYRKNVLRYIAIHCFPYIFSEIQIISQYWISLNFEPYTIESELYICIHDCMKNIYKGILVTGIHLLDLQLLQDKNWMKNKQFNKKREKLRYIAIRISYCDTILILCVLRYIDILWHPYCPPPHWPCDLDFDLESKNRFLDFVTARVLVFHKHTLILCQW